MEDAQRTDEITKFDHAILLNVKELEDTVSEKVLHSRIPKHNLLEFLQMDDSIIGE